MRADKIEIIRLKEINSDIYSAKRISSMYCHLKQMRLKLQSIELAVPSTVRGKVTQADFLKKNISQGPITHLSTTVKGQV